jgi:hypothetical protein
VTWLAGLLLRFGVPQRLIGAVTWVVAALAIAGAAALAVVLIHKNGEQAGAATAALQGERVRQRRIAEARADERTAAQAAQSIADRTARADAVTDVVLEHTIKDLRDALDAVPATPAACAGGELPAAPVDRLRDLLNAGIARANRAAGDAGAAPDAGAD